MIQTSKIEKQQIFSLLQSAQWPAIEQFSESLCEEIKNGAFIGDTEWETVKSFLLQEGQVQGIKRFLAELYNQTKDV